MTTPAGRILRRGTVTFLFLDIEKSTGHLEELGSEYPLLLETYWELTGRAIADRGGVIFGSEGDGLFIAFPEAGAPPRSAIEAQAAYATAQWPHGSTVFVGWGSTPAPRR